MKRILLLMLVAASRLAAASITASGSWTNSWSAADLVAGAGSNLPSTATSLSSVILLDVAFTPALANYHVYARISSSPMPSGVTLWIKRTSDGSSFLTLGAIAGGTSLTQLSTTDTEIFYGFLDRSSISLQLSLTGVSVAMAPATYQPNVIFTITP